MKDLTAGTPPVVGIHIGDDFEIALIAFFLFVLSISILKCSYQWLFRYLFWLPESAYQVIAGAVLGCITLSTKFEDVLVVLDFFPPVFLLLMLPPVAYEAGYNTDRKRFFQEIVPIFNLALLGTIVSAGFVGFCLYAVSSTFKFEYSLRELLVFGALLSATDPIAVLVAFDEFKVNGRLTVVVSSEAVLNDASAIVLYNVAVALFDIPHVDVRVPFEAIAKLVYITVGSPLAGVIWGLVVTWLTKITYFYPLAEMAILLSGMLGLYLVCDFFFLSGIVAVMFFGMFVSTYTQKNLDSFSRHAHSWVIRMASSTVDTAVFVWIGIGAMKFFFFERAVDISDRFDWPLILFTLLFITVSRFLHVYVFLYGSNLFRPIEKRFPHGDIFIAAFAGLRGGVAFALSLTLQANKAMGHPVQMIVATLMCALVTLVIQGTATKPLLKILKIKTQEDDSPNSNRPSVPKNNVLRRIVEFYEGLICKYLIRKSGDPTLSITELVEVATDRSKNSLQEPGV